MQRRKQAAAAPVAITSRFVSLLFYYNVSKLDHRYTTFLTSKNHSADEFSENYLFFWHIYFLLDLSHAAVIFCTAILYSHIRRRIWVKENNEKRRRLRKDFFFLFFFCKKILEFYIIFSEDSYFLLKLPRWITVREGEKKNKRKNVRHLLATSPWHWI